LNFARRKRRIGLTHLPRLPLVAFIDVVLFLLLYFVLATNFVPDEKELSTTLRGQAQGRSGSGLIPQILRVEVSGDAVVFRLGDRVTVDRDALVDLLSRLPKDGGLFIQVGERVPVGGAAKAIQAASEAGFAKISYVGG
jgi:biopolymer transport protein ExbD